MTNEKFNAIVEAINNEIKYGVYEFKNNGSSEYYNRIYSRICGMIEVLRIATDDNYYFDENGLHYEDGAIVEPKTDKRVEEIEGYSVYLPSAGHYTIMVLSSDNTVVEFEELNRAEMPVLLHAIKSDDAVEKFVVADSHGAYL